MADIIIDNADAEFSKIGVSWAGGSDIDPFAYGDDGYFYCPSGTTGHTATWAFTGLVAGTYHFYITWFHFANRATNVSVKIKDGDGADLSSQTINQQLECGDLLDGRVGWKYLGQFTTTVTSPSIVMSADGIDAAKFCIADAVRVSDTLLVSTLAITKATGDFDDAATWLGGVIPEDGIGAIIRGHVVTVPVGVTAVCGDGTNSVQLDMTTDLNARLIVDGGDFTLRGHAATSDDTAAGIAGIGATTFIKVQNNGTSRGIFRFDANSGVLPEVRGYRMSYLWFRGTTAAKYLIETKVGSAGGHGRFVDSALGSLGGFFNLGQDTPVPGEIVGEIYRIGDATHEAIMATFVGIMCNTYVDVATCGVMPRLSLLSGTSFLDSKYNKWGNVGDIPLGTSVIGVPFGGAFVSNTTEPLTVGGRRDIVGNRFNSASPNSFYMATLDFTIRNNVFNRPYYNNVDFTYNADINENFFYCDSPLDNDAGGISWGGSSQDNFVLAGPFAPQGMGYELNDPNSHIGNVCQNLAAKEVVYWRANDGGTNRTITAKNNVCIPTVAGGGQCLIHGFARAAAITSIVVEHNSVHLGSAPDEGGVMLWGNDSGPTPPDIVHSCQSNIFTSDHSPANSYAMTSENYGSMTEGLDSAPADTLDYNCWDGLKLSPAGEWDAIVGDTNVSDGTVYHCPMSGALVPGGNDFPDTDPQYLDDTRDALTYAVLFASASGTDEEKIEDLMDWLDDDPETRNIDLVDWTKVGFQVTNVVLEDAGHDDETVGAMGFTTGEAEPSFTIAPSTIPADHAGVMMLVVTGTGTSFVEGETVFNLSGVDDVVKVSQVVLTTELAHIFVRTA